MARVSPSRRFQGKHQKPCSVWAFGERGGERGISSHAQGLFLTCLPLPPPPPPPKASSVSLHPPTAPSSRLRLGVKPALCRRTQPGPTLLTHTHSSPFMLHIRLPGTFWLLTPSRGDVTSTQTHTFLPQAKMRGLCPAASLGGATCLQTQRDLVSSSSA